MNVLLQRLSISHIIVAWFILRKAKKITLFDPYTIESAKDASLHDQITLKILNKIFNIKIEKLDRDLRNRLGYINNQASDIYVEALMNRARHCASYQIIRRIVSHKAVDRIYCRQFLPKVQVTSQFYRLAEFFLKEQKALILIPGDDDYWKIQRHFNLNKVSIPPLVKVLNKASCQMRRILTALIQNCIAWPAIFISHIFKCFRLKYTQSMMLSPVIMPLVSGFPQEGNILHFPRGKKKSEWNSTSLLGNGLNQSTVAFYYSDWRFDAKRRIIQERWMLSHRIKWFDPKKFHANRAHLLKMRTLTIELIKAFFRTPNFLIDPHEVVRISVQALFYFLNELLFNHNVDYKVRVEWAEYSPESVMRTIVANRFGRVTVGVHHSANSLTGEFPEIRYLYLNRLCLWNEGFRKAYGHHWDEIECVPIGNHRLDYVLRALEPARHKELKAIVKRLWKVSGHIIFMPLPNHPDRTNYQNPERFSEFYKGILQCLEEIPDLWIVFRARFSQDWEDYLREPLMHKIIACPRVFTDYEVLSTYEWIALADVVIGNSDSTVIVEAGAAGKKCFSFDTRVFGEMTFGKYGTDFVLTKSEHLVRAIKGSLYKKPRLDCKWEQFARDMTYFADGNNMKRFRDAIWELTT